MRVFPKIYVEWTEDQECAIWWDVSNTNGEISEPPSYIGGPNSSDWPFNDVDTSLLLWIPFPQLASNKPKP